MASWDEITQPENFAKFIIVILNGIEARINYKPHRIGEVEIYYHCDHHPDNYVHQDELQCDFGKLYFHRFRNGSYKGGNYKGCDMTFGKDRVRLSLLIRTIQNLETGEIISGPCNVVNYLLRSLNYLSIKNLVDELGNFSILTSNPAFYLLPLRECSQDKIFHGPRVGLSDKYPEFKDRLYRFVSNSMYKGVKKQKTQLKIFYS